MLLPHQVALLQYLLSQLAVVLLCFASRRLGVNGLHLLCGLGLTRVRVGLPRGPLPRLQPLSLSYLIICAIEPSLMEKAAAPLKWVLMWSFLKIP